LKLIATPSEYAHTFRNKKKVAFGQLENKDVVVHTFGALAGYFHVYLVKLNFCAFKLKNLPCEKNKFLL